MNPELVNLEREKTAKEILDKVNTVFVFGATNKQRTREARRKFDLLLKAITDLFLSTKKETVNKRERFFKKHSKQRAVFDKLLEEALIVSDTSNFTPGIFKPAEKILKPPPEAFISPDLFKLLITFYGPERFNWIPEDIENLYAYFADYAMSFVDTTQVSEMQSKGTPELWERLKEERKFIAIYETGKTFQTLAERFLFLIQTVRDVSNSPYFYGVGNCGLMADTAFLEAMSRNLNYPVTYIRFVNRENPKVDIINAIALGDWPNPGCLIISPWQETHKQYYWQGSIDETPEIKAVNSYNDVKIIFSFKPDDPDHDKLVGILQELEYSTWLTLKGREETITRVREHVKGFQAALEEAGYLPKSEAPKTVSNENLNEIPRPPSPSR